MNAIATLPPGTADATVCVASVASPLGPMPILQTSINIGAVHIQGLDLEARYRAPAMSWAG